MNHQDLFLSEDEIPRLLNAMADEYDIIFFARKEMFRYQDLSEEGKRQISLREPRSSFSAKSFFMPARECVAEYGIEVKRNEEALSPSSRKPLALVNLRNCDVEAIHVLDQIFLQGDFIDPTYQQRRDSILLVSVDCVQITEFCFCPKLGSQPYVKNGTALNLSPITGGYVIGANTPAGEAILERCRSFATPVHAGQKQEVERNRQAVLTQLQESNEKFVLPATYHDILKNNPTAEKWNDLFNTCVECACCTNICPTCYCFYLFDRSKCALRNDSFERFRSWDSCLLADYSRMAGVGGVKPNPRSQLRTRYMNRFRHKYLFHFDTYGRYGCTGCGRCTESCMGKTDPREVMRVLGQ